MSGCLVEPIGAENLHRLAPVICRERLHALSSGAPGLEAAWLLLRVWQPGLSEPACA